jgi:large conductance mechanosensitive channel
MPDCQEQPVIKEFKSFIMRGNIVDLAVAVIIGTAFGAVISSLTKDVLMAFIAAVVGEPNFDAVQFEVGDGVIEIGKFLTASVNFLIIAFVLFLILKAVNTATTRFQQPDADAPTPAPTDEAVLLTEIRDLLAQRSS